MGDSIAGVGPQAAASTRWTGWVGFEQKTQILDGHTFSTPIPERPPGSCQMSVDTPGVTVMMTAVMHATVRAHATTANGTTAAHGGTATTAVAAQDPTTQRN